MTTARVLNYLGIFWLCVNNLHFIDYQLQTLERSFEKQNYLSFQDRQELAALDF